jgi:toxoflavin biosynthesis protein ToxC
MLWEHGNLVNSVAVLADGQAGIVVASAARDHTVKVGRIGPDGRTATVVQTLLGPDESVKCVGVLGTVDSPVVLAGSYDFALYTWDVDWAAGGATLVRGRVLAEFTQAVSCICPVDATTAAVASWDGTVVLVERDGDGVVRVRRRLDLAGLAGLAAASAALPEAVSA